MTWISLEVNMPGKKASECCGAISSRLSLISSIEVHPACIASVCMNCLRLVFFIV